MMNRVLLGQLEAGMLLDDQIQGLMESLRDSRLGLVMISRVVSTS